MGWHPAATACGCLGYFLELDISNLRSHSLQSTIIATIPIPNFAVLERAPNPVFNLYVYFPFLFLC